MADCFLMHRDIASQAIIDELADKHDVPF